MLEFDKTRIPDHEKIRLNTRKRVLVEDFLPVIYQLTDLTVNLSILEVKDELNSVLRFKAGINRIRSSLNDWLKKIHDMKRERKIKFFRERLTYRSMKEGPFYPNFSFFDDRELLSKFMPVIEEANHFLDILRKLEMTLGYHNLLEAQITLKNLQTSLKEWNVRMNELRVMYTYRDVTTLNLSNEVKFVKMQGIEKINANIYKQQ